MIDVNSDRKYFGPVSERAIKRILEISNSIVTA